MKGIGASLALFDLVHARPCDQIFLLAMIESDVPYRTRLPRIIPEASLKIGALDVRRTELSLNETPAYCAADERDLR